MATLRLATIEAAGPEAAGRVAVCGDDGGRRPGWRASRSGLRAVILNDAGGGLHGAGLAGVFALASVGMAAAAVAAGSARIGDAEDMAARGVISAVNRVAEAAGVAPGMGAAEAAALLDAAAPPPEGALPPAPAGRSEGVLAGRPVLLVDAAGLIRRDDAGRIAVTGAAGALVAGDPRGVPEPSLALIVWNDAAIGADRAGIAALQALEPRGVPSVAVSHASARIGEAASTLGGVVTAANFPARRRGLLVGMRLADAVASLP